MKTVEFCTLKRYGYEGLYSFKVLGCDRLLYAHAVEYASYFDGVSAFPSEPKIVNVEFSIETVLNISIQSGETAILFIQPKNRSPDSHCVVVIEKIVDSDTFTCHIDMLGEVTVELEVPNSQLREGMKVAFDGYLEIDFIEQ